MKRKAAIGRRRLWWRRRAVLMFAVILLFSHIGMQMNDAGGLAFAEGGRWNEVGPESQRSKDRFDDHASGFQRMIGYEPPVVDMRGSFVQGLKPGKLGDGTQHAEEKNVDRKKPDKPQPVRLTQEEMAAAYGSLSKGKPVAETARPYEKPDKPTVYLTFDDGPSVHTPQVLDILQEEGVQGTFFILGQLAERNADTVRRIVQEGHAVGNHTYNHDYSMLYTEFGSFFDQIKRTDGIIEEISGIRTALFRAPGGTHTNFDVFYSYYMEQAGFTVYDWDVDSGDSKRRGVPASEIIANVKKAPLKHEMNVLLHDSAGHQETVKALPEIIRYFKNLGYSFAVLDPEVEPRRFTLSGLKWNRTVSLQDHVRYTEMTEQYRIERELAVDEAPPQRNKPLILTIDGRSLVLDGQEYEVADGHFIVELDSLLDGFGGRMAASSAGNGRADVRMNGITLTYDPADQSKMIRPDAREEATLAPIEISWRNGRLYVPLRATIEALGGAIPSYTLSEDRQEVRIRTRASGDQSPIYAASYHSVLREYLRLARKI